MFPPAQLPLEAALRESALAPRLGSLVAADLVVPLAQLPEAGRDAARRAGFGMTRCTLCVVGVEVAQGFAAAEAVRAHARANAPMVAATALEVHGASFRAPEVAALRDALGPARLFVEPRWDPAQWPRAEGTLLGILERLRGDAPVGLKVRGVGETAVDNAALARLLPQVAAAAIPLKATQGLHHPLADPGRGHLLGFLSLAFAVRLAHLRPARPATLLRVLEERDPRAFTFGDGVAWRGERLGADEVAASRAELPFTIGSCSLEEPAEGLRRLFGDLG